MDQAIIGSIFTVVVFVAFFGAVYWAFNSRNKERFEDVAASIISDDDIKDDNRLSKKDQES
jgi:cytochrome c oxidase cbb3-type subunit 4